MNRLFDFIATFSPATQALRREHAQLRERYATLTDNLAAAIVIRERGGRITYCSPYIEVLTGYSRQEVYGDRDFFGRIVTPEDRERYDRSLKVSECGEAFQCSYRIMHKSGIEIWAETRIVPILDGDGQVVATLSITLDVTRPLRYQRQVEERNRDLQEFSYMVSHDLKAPIATIKGMVALVSEEWGAGLDAEFKEVLGHIGQAADRLDQLARAVIEYSRLNSQETVAERVDLNQVLKDVAADHAAQVKSSAAEIIIDPDLPAVLSDRLKTYQIFSNLIGNALKYRAGDRALIIKVTQLKNLHDRQAEIAVIDNGSGIPADRIAQIFRPFHRAHGREIEGAGIGLATVKKLAEQMGGQVRVESELGRGSHFMVTLRRAE